MESGMELRGASASRELDLESVLILPSINATRMFVESG